jgi:hypothetical protein
MSNWSESFEKNFTDIYHFLVIDFSEDWYKDNPEVNKNNKGKKQRRK